MKLITRTILVAVLSLLTLNATAQENDEFSPYFYLHLQGGAGYTVGEADYWDLVSPAAALSFGYQFNPIFGTRLGISGLQGRGGIPAIDETFKYNYIQGSVDVTMDLCNLFAGYKDRVANPYIFAGLGYLHGFNNDEAVAIYDAGQAPMANLWRDSKGFLSGRAGVGVEFKVTERVGITLEGNLNMLSDEFNSKDAPNLDWQYNALAGVKIKLGKSKKESTPVATTPVAPAPEKEEPKPQPKEESKPQPKEESKPQPKEASAKVRSEYNVFFDIGSAVVNSEGKVVVEDLAKYLNSNPSTEVSLVGYADKQTGSVQYNSSLSEKRSAAVASMLESKGISKSRISTSYKGDTVQPFSVNEKNRVVICIVE